MKIKSLNGFVRSLRSNGYLVKSSSEIRTSFYHVVLDNNFMPSLPPTLTADDVHDYISAVNHFHDLYHSRVSYLCVDFDHFFDYVNLYVSFK